VQRVLANGSSDRSNLFARSLPAARLLNGILGGLGGPVARSARIKPDGKRFVFPTPFVDAIDS
jgi:hypothetical protein